MAAQNGMKGPPPLKQDRLLLPDLFQLPPSCWFGQKTAGPSLQPLLLSDQGLKLQPGIFLLPAALPLPLGTAASILELNMVIRLIARTDILHIVENSPLLLKPWRSVAISC